MREFDDEGRAALRVKYRALKELGDARLARAATGATSFPEEERPARRRAMKELAARFPGTLRELDLYDPDEVARRIAALESTRTEPWMPVVARYHQVLAGLLARREGSPRPSRAAMEIVARELGLDVDGVRDALG